MYKNRRYWLFSLILMVMVAVNMVLVMGVHVLFYPVPSKVDALALAEADALYEGAQIVNAHVEDDAQLLLVRTSDGETRIVPLEKHPVFTRYKIAEDDTVVVDAAQDMVSVDVVVGSSLYRAAVAEGTYLAAEKMGGIIDNAVRNYFAIAAVLTIAELFIGSRFYKMEE